MMCCEVVVDRNSIFGHVTTTLVVLQSHFEYPKGALGSSEMNYFPKNHEKVDFFVLLKNDSPSHGTSRNTIGCVVRSVFSEKIAIFGTPRGPLGSSEMNYFWKIMKKSCVFFVLKTILPCMGPRELPLDVLSEVYILINLRFFVPPGAPG